MEEAVKQLATEGVKVSFVRDQKTYRWYGRSVGDYPIPEGFTAEDLGKCDHVITVDGSDYDIGVVRNKTNDGTYSLLFDFWGTGKQIVDVLGNQTEKLKSAYNEQVALKVARSKGHRVQMFRNSQGKRVLRAYVR